jgi:hypothetical protein
MKNRASKHLYAYWNEVRGDRLAPRRFEIEPARIAALLPDAFILERFGDMDIRYRLAGTRLIEQFGTDFRGASFFDGFVATDRRIIERQIRDLISHGGGCMLEITSTTPLGRSVMHECVILPLIHMRETVDRFVGVITASAEPDWLGEEPLTERTLTAFQAILADPAGDGRGVLPFPQPPVFDGNVREARIVRSNRRYFRVYQGGLATEEEKR